MSNKTITWILALIIFTFFSVFFVIQNYVYDNGNRIQNRLFEIKQAIKLNQWDQASNLSTELYDIWEKGKHLVSLNNAEQEFLNFDNNIQKLKGAVEAKNSSLAIEMVLSAENDWQNFKKIVPMP